MDILKRISNLAKLSSYEPELRRLPIQFSDGTEIVDLVKKPQQQAEFIPYKKVDPIKQLIEEQP